MIDRESLRVYRLSIFVLAVEWVFFGSCHFAMLQETERQIPPGIPFKTFIAVTTGMAEVTTGILLLVSRTRKWAAVASLVLLALFLPSIYRMMVVDEAVGVPSAWVDLVRVLLVPNHVFMALCAVYLIRWPNRPAEEPRARTPRAAWPVPTFAGGGAAVTVALILLAANIAGFVVVLGSPLRGNTAILWALMCLAVGGLVGFVFGVPRVSYGAGTGVTHRPNSNVEMISDWLTKIIVGVGLVQFHNLGGFLNRVSGELGQAVARDGDAAGASAFARALIIYFFVTGLIEGYLLTRMYLAERFEEFEAAPVVATAAQPAAA